MGKFDYKEYIRSLVEELVLQFKRARLSTHNVAKGENKESSVIQKLKSSETAKLLVYVNHYA